MTRPLVMLDKTSPIEEEGLLITDAEEGIFKIVLPGIM
jgi:hypothetical protein